MYFIFALKQWKSPGLRKVFVSDMYIDNVKSTFHDHLSDIFKNIVCILNCHSLSNTCMSFPFSSFFIIIFSLSLIIIFLTICDVFGVRDFVLCFCCWFCGFFSPYLLCVPYFTPRLFLSLLVTEIFSSDKKNLREHSDIKT